MKIILNFKDTITLIWKDGIDTLRNTIFENVEDCRVRKNIWMRACRCGAKLSFDEFEKYYEQKGEYVYEKKINRLILFMIGDCIGKPFEFKLKKDLNNLDLINYVNSHINKFQTVSDDTQLMYLTIKSILENTDFYKELDIWKTTIVRKEDAPGQACLYAADKHSSDKESLGSGALMRMPAYEVLGKRATRMMMLSNALKTHSNILSTKCCSILLELIDNKNLDNMDTSYLSDTVVTQDCWKCDEILKYCLYIVNKSNSFLEILEKAVLIDGDSDTVAAIAMFIASYKFENAAEDFIDFIDISRFSEICIYKKLIEEIL